MQPTRSLTFGDHLRSWRRRRRLSQLDLAVEAKVSTRHLSYVETGRANPSREMVMKLLVKLGVPLRERNQMLMAAGYAPRYRECRLGDGALAAARRSVELLLKRHEPCPALALDRHWNLLAHNAQAALLFAGVDPVLMRSPTNFLRLALHPAGLAPRVVNLVEWRGYLFERLEREIGESFDAALIALLAELRALPAGTTSASFACAGAVVPLVLNTDLGILSFIGTTTHFSSPVDVTLQEIALETFFPLDDVTQQQLALFKG